MTNLQNLHGSLFMKNRLSSAKSLLSEDGVIWVQLDDRLSHYCKVMMDEVFGSENFVSNIIWQKSILHQMTLSGLVTTTIIYLFLQKINQFLDESS